MLLRRKYVVKNPAARIPGDCLSRRRFVRNATRAGAALTALSLPIPNAFAARPHDFKIGVIGCGGRGNGAAQNAIEAGKITGDKVSIHAIADVFPDKLVRPLRAFGVDKARAFSGFQGYRKLLELDLDYVILATPPHFRPEHFEAVVAAGKNVFTEKPVAVDPPGIRRFLLAGYRSKLNHLSVAAGTQRRHRKQYQAAQERVAGGAIGDIVSGRCYWNQGGLWSVEPRTDWTEMEWQIRDWLYFTWLSGDHIVEQHVHQLDVMNWFLGSHPIAARGMGGREVRRGKDKYGNVFDHFATELIYPSPNPTLMPDVRVMSMARQIDGCWNDVSEFFAGTTGSTDCKSLIRSSTQPWEWSGKQVGAYVQEHIDLMASIKGQGYLNEAENVGTSTMTAILARTACYTGTEVKWDDLLKRTERLGPESYSFGPAPKVAVARPGSAM
jgi:predicted dehydrogenase